MQQYVKWRESIIHECYRTLSKTGSMCWQVGNYVENGSVLPIDILLHPIFDQLGMKMRNRITGISSTDSIVRNGSRAGMKSSCGSRNPMTILLI